MGNSSSGHVQHVTVVKPNPAQVQQAAAVAAKVAAAQKQLSKPEQAHKELEKRLNGFNLSLTFVDKFLAVGPKGTGKSTFLWLRGEAGGSSNLPKPEFSATDGTQATIYYDDAADSVGIAIVSDTVLRLMALLIYKQAIPKSIILFSQRPLPDIAILKHLLITDVNVCTLQGALTHQLNEAVYDTNMEDELRQHGHSVIRHDSAPPADEGFKTAIAALFPTGRITAPAYSDFSSKPNANPTDTARTTICRYIDYLATSKKSDLEFLNSTAEKMHAH